MRIDIDIGLVLACTIAATGCSPPAPAEEVLAGPRPRPPADRAFDVGFNKFDLAISYIGTASGGDGSAQYRATTIAMARKALFDARDAGATFVRTAVTGYGPGSYGEQTDLAHWINDPIDYWAAMDRLFDDVDAAGMMLVPSFVWRDIQFPALSGSDTLGDLLTDPSSSSSTLLANYLTEFITRYAGRDSILFYEVGNEINLGADIDLVGYMRSQGLPTDLYVNYTTDQLNAFVARVAGQIRALDPSRPISSGHAMPRPTSFRARRGRSGLDTIAEMDSHLLDTHAMVDVVSVHMYASDAQDDFRRHGMTPRQIVAHLQSVASSAGKRLYIGEFGDAVSTHGPAERAGFYGEVYAAIREQKVPYTSPWILEFYQFAVDQFDPVFHIEPGYTDGILDVIRGAAREAGTYTDPADPDGIAPQVVLTVPRDGQTLSSRQKLYAVASDDRGAAARVEFSIDQTPVGVATSPPYTIEVDTGALASGAHTVRARAVDAAGNAVDHAVQVRGGGGPEAPGPTVSFTTNGATDVITQAGAELTYRWAVDGAVAVRSEVTILGGMGDSCGNRNGPWAVSSAQGELTAAVAACQAGFTYLLSVIATGPAGNEVRAVNTVTVRAAPRVRLTAAGSGCDDRFCVWITGTGFTSDVQVIVRDAAWNPIGTYTGADLQRTLDSLPQVLSLRLATDAERSTFAATGIIVTVAGAGSWDSRAVSR